MEFKVGSKNSRWCFWLTLSVIAFVQMSCVSGPPGPPGPPGNLELAGKACPQGEFVVGFDANGDIICGVAGSDTLKSFGINGWIRNKSYCDIC